MRFTHYLLILTLLFGISSIAHSQKLTQEDYCTNGLCPLDSLSKAYLLFGQPLEFEWIQGEDDSTQHISFDGIEIYGDENGSIIRYEIRSNKFRTSRSISVGDSASAVKIVYGEPKKVGWTNDLIYGSETLFYAFELKNDRVNRIIVGFYHHLD